jgi:hypothetical protein
MCCVLSLLFCLLLLSVYCFEWESVYVGKQKTSLHSDLVAGQLIKRQWRVAEESCIILG